ncbi:TonB-dependent receptor plug domain-containing protein [Geoalkalibacter halelectricus]|uniref:TonB-dependent receptor n=1 Tax=Geoalkalibacter halelectricus TaxID=2847045 RepID=A0ABY5ZM32_9BACT|nr:TonB-dependent receptor [Geoalkalibacter halelectricus]MDO3378781.1 TonB-dependent receptor [Geoalkalibacter halelectricus]UWZ79914.1 TonB-dependent receptor [Geoalkalibacter halelectricus]
MKQVLLALGGLFLVVLAGLAVPTLGKARSLTDFSLEELMAMEVTTPAKSPRRFDQTPAAVFVITAEDIRRSGATTIPDLLRMVPGMQVAHIDGNKWAVSARGFNSRFANKLLVLIDGRSVYTPTFSGVYWDVQDTLLADIERIEVIRGPGGSLWGANAVNGIVNIITKSARDTQGGLAQARAGNLERGGGALRYGGKSGQNHYWRGFVQYFDRGPHHALPGETAEDDWQSWRGGFRSDRYPAPDEQLTLQGEAYGSRAGAARTEHLFTAPFVRTNTEPTQTNGGFLLARRSWEVSPAARNRLQAFVDHFQRRRNLLDEDERRTTLDVDFQNELALAAERKLTWGLGYRVSRGSFSGGQVVTYHPQRQTEHLLSVFAQAELPLVEERLTLYAGSKAEHFSSVGLEIQPSLRLLWTPSSRHSLWASAARAVGIPSRADQEALIILAVVPSDPPLPLTSQGNPNIKAESLKAFEIGYRALLNDSLSLDIATFYNIYDDLRNFEGEPAAFTLPAPLPPMTALYTSRNNETKVHSQGVEVALSWQAHQRLRLMGAYSYIDLRVKPRLGVEDFDFSAQKTPRHQASLRTWLDLPREWELNTWLRYVDALERGPVPSYVELDAKLSWAPRANLTLALVGRNLLDGRHQEFPLETFLKNSVTEVRRQVFAEAVLTF